MIQFWNYADSLRIEPATYVADSVHVRDNIFLVSDYIREFVVFSLQLLLSGICELSQPRAWVKRARSHKYLSNGSRTRLHAQICCIFTSINYTHAHWASEWNLMRLVQRVSNQRWTQARFESLQARSKYVGSEIHILIRRNIYTYIYMPR